MKVGKKMEIKVKKINENDYENIFVMTDLHGCYDLFIKMINEINFTKKDLLIILGDSCDRGKKSYELYNWYNLKEKEGYKIIHLLGNHEDMIFRGQNDKNYKDNWILNGGHETIKSFYNNFEEKEHILNEKIFFEKSGVLEYIDKMFHIVESEKHLFVHAGIDFSKSLFEQEHNNILWRRDRWFEKNNSKKVVFYGHTPKRNITIKNNCVNLDSGVFHTNKLNCVEIKKYKLYILENNKIIEKKLKIKKSILDFFQFLNFKNKK